MDLELILLRLDQIEARVKDKHPRMARDLQLAAQLRSLREEVEALRASED